MFNGTPTFEQISPTEFRITGLSLSPNGATGTIGFADAGGATPPDIRLPDTFPRPSGVSFGGKPVSLAAIVDVRINPTTAGGFTNLQPTVQKTGEGADFRIAIVNTKVDEDTQELEIRLTLLGQGRADGISICVAYSPEAQVNVYIDAATAAAVPATATATTATAGTK